MIKRVAVVEWAVGDGLACGIQMELRRLGIEPVPFPFDGAVPNHVDMVFTFGPYGRILPIASQMGRFHPKERPLYVHWSNQCQPNPNIPWMFTRRLAQARCWLERLTDSQRPAVRVLSNLEPMDWLRKRMIRFLILGELQYAHSQGWLDILVEASNLYTQQDIAHGIPAIFIPWGTFPEYYAELQLKRDIDVVWFGKRRIRQRSQLLDAIRNELRTHGVEIYIVDGVERPFIYGDERTHLLNRSKITLSLRNYVHDYTIPPRFHVVAGNRCLLICEPELNHHLGCVPGKHYIAVEANEIVEKILYYLSHEDERNQITDNAYKLATQELTMSNSLEAIVTAAESRLANRSYSVTVPGGIQRLVPLN